MEPRGALKLGDVDLRKLSILICVVLAWLRTRLAVRRRNSSAGKAINGDVVDG